MKRHGQIETGKQSTNRKKSPTEWFGFLPNFLQDINADGDHGHYVHISFDAGVRYGVSFDGVKIVPTVSFKGVE